MFISEFIVGLWFLPVVLFILAPLAMFSAWSLYRIMGEISEKVLSGQWTVKHLDEESYSPLQTRQAV